MSHEFQSAYKQLHSTLTALLEVHNDIDNDKVTALICLLCQLFLILLIIVFVLRCIWCSFKFVYILY